MAASKPLIYECYSELLNICIYGIDIQNLYPMEYHTIPSSAFINGLFPDILEKMRLNHKNAILLYSGDVELFQWK